MMGPIAGAVLEAMSGDEELTFWLLVGLLRRANTGLGMVPCFSKTFE